MAEYDSCPTIAPFLGYMGVAASIILASKYIQYPPKAEAPLSRHSRNILTSVDFSPPLQMLALPWVPHERVLALCKLELKVPSWCGET
jgi:hypothetical protein